MGSRSFEKSKEAWSSLVYNKDITQSEVLDAYKVNYYSERLCVLLTAACWLTLRSAVVKTDRFAPTFSIGFSVFSCRTGP